MGETGLGEGKEGREERGKRERRRQGRGDGGKERSTGRR